MNIPPSTANAVLLLAVATTFLVDPRPPRSMCAIRIHCIRRRVPRQVAPARFDIGLPRAGQAIHARPGPACPTGPGQPP